LRARLSSQISISPFSARWGLVAHAAERERGGDGFVGFGGDGDADRERYTTATGGSKRLAFSP
jgi:hypothetical protein